MLACNAAEAEAEEDPDDEAKTKTAQDEKTKLHSFRRTLRTQGRIAFQDVELRLTEANITQTELAKRREEVKQGGHLQKMLLEAAAGVARKQKQQVGETDAADDADTYAADDLQDARDQQGDEVVVNNFSTETNADETVTTQPDVPAACATLMDVLVSQEDIDKSEKSCRLCQADDTVDSTKQAALYKPGQLNQHLGTDFHSPRKRFLRKHKAKAVCPYGCGKKFTGSKLLAHVWKDIEQSDQHLLAAAKDGLFARDFNPSANRISSAVTRVVDGEAKKIEAGDPNTVPLKAVVRAENIDRSSGNVMERSLVGTHTEKPVLRLPTANPVSEGPWWHGHDDGIYGDVADTLQQQRTWIADQLDANLRRLGHGRADESGTTRQNPFQSERKTKGIATLRKRLQEELSWAWAEDHDHVEQPDDDAEEGDNEEGDGDGSDDDGA